MKIDTKRVTEDQEKNLQGLLRQSCKLRLYSSLKIDGGVDIEELSNPDDFLYGQWMSVILLSGQALQCTLKMHYFNDTALALSSHSLGLARAKIKPGMLTDYMRELTNLFAGEIKAQLFANKILVGISLPLITRGFDEILFSDNLGKFIVRDYWKFLWSGNEIVLTAETEVFQPDIFNSVTIKEFNAEDEGDIDFL